MLRFNGGRPRDHILSIAIAVFTCFAVSTVYLCISALQSVIILAVLLVYSFITRSGNTAKKILSPVIFELILIVASSLCSNVYSHIFSMSLDELFAQASIARCLHVISAKIIISVVIFILLRLTTEDHLQNPIDRSVMENNPNLSTTKAAKELHGYGIKSMKGIVERANGFIDFYEEERRFCVQIALPIE